MSIHCFDDSNALENYFADYIEKLLISAIDSRGHAYLVVSGGKTPLGLFEKLSNKRLPWDKVIITLADERCISASHKDSNEHFVKENFLKNHASEAQFIPLYREHRTLKDINTTIENLPTFDAVILGMGEDGHTASLFPCSKVCREGLAEDNTSSVLWVTPETASYQRISMTRNRLMNTNIMFLHIIGEKKWDVLNKAMSFSDYPINAFLKHNNFHVLYSSK